MAIPLLKIMKSVIIANVVIRVLLSTASLTVIGVHSFVFQPHASIVGRGLWQPFSYAYATKGSQSPDANPMDEQDVDTIEEEETTSPTTPVTEIPSDLSDEDLLLACRSYLQRKNRLGQWTEFEKRKENLQRQRQESLDSQSGFFWDDPTELKYYRQQTQMITPANVNFDTDDADDDADAGMMLRIAENEGEEDGLMGNDFSGGNTHRNNNNNNGEEDIIRYTSAATMAESFVPEPSTKLEEIRFDLKGQNEEERLEQWARHFTKFPTQPSKSQQIRSNAIKRRWNDPEWKARWHERRWGGKTVSSQHHSANSNNTSAAESLRKPVGVSQWKQKVKISALTPEFLSSDVFTSLTEEEIGVAVHTYLRSNRKRAESRKLSQEERRITRTSPLLSDDANEEETSTTNYPNKSSTTSTNFTIHEKLPRDALAWDRDPQALEEARRIRSERAKKAYQTRITKKKEKENTTSDSNSTNILQKGAAKPTKSTVASKPHPSGQLSTLDDSPKEALNRVELAVDQGELPQLQDLRLISVPSKLPKRKKLLLRLLSEQFGMRGKCIPVEGTNTDQQGKFLFITNCKLDQLMTLALDRVGKAHSKTIF